MTLCARKIHTAQCAWLANTYDWVDIVDTWQFMWSCMTLHVALQALFGTLFVSSLHFLDGTAVQHFPAKGDSAKQKGGKL